MNRIILPIVLFGLTGCAGTYKTTFDHSAAAEPVNIHVAPIVTKEELDVQIVQADSSAATAQYGLIGAMVGAVIDSAINKKRAIQAERKAEVLREANAGYDVFGAAHRTALQLGNGESWNVVVVDEPTSTAGIDDVAARSFEAGDASSVAVLVFDYMLTPAATQVRVKVDQRIYKRSDKPNSKGIRRANSTRGFVYLSPVEALNIREYGDGEKEALIQSVRDDYAERMVAHPEEQEDLQQAMETELEDLEESTTIPEAVALQETWSAELLRRYLEQSIDHLAFMLRYDWDATIVPETEQRTKDSYLVVADTGFGLSDKGEEVARKDDNTIYRSQWGAMYSVPNAIATGD